MKKIEFDFFINYKGEKLRMSIITKRRKYEKLYFNAILYSKYTK